MNLLPTPPRWAVPLLSAGVAAVFGALLAPGDGVASATGRLVGLSGADAPAAFGQVESLVREEPGSVSISSDIERDGSHSIELELSGPDAADLALTVNRVLNDVATATDAGVEPAEVDESPRDRPRAQWAFLGAVLGLIGGGAVVSRSVPPAVPRRPSTSGSALPVEHLYAETDPESDAAVALHAVARAVLDRPDPGGGGTPRPRIVVAGTTPADRGAELAANLAIALAHQGVRVRLLDQDRATTAVSTFLGLQPGQPGTIPLGGGRSVDCLTIARNAPIPFTTAGARDAMAQWIDGFDVLVVHLSPRAWLDDVTRWSAAADAVLVARLEDRPTTLDDAWATDGTIPTGRHLGIAHQAATDP